MPRYDQHFLTDRNIVRKIIAAVDPGPTDLILEIGPGDAALTDDLVAAAGAVCAVEIDPVAAGTLTSRYAGDPRFTLVHGDFLEFDIGSITIPEGWTLKIAGNIPYSITTPILERLYTASRWSRAVIMLQREVAQRMLARPGTAAYSRLTLWTNFYSTVTLVCIVSRSCFRPKPAVDSAVIRLEPNLAYTGYRHRERLFSVIAAAFSQRRKTLVNSLHSRLGIAKEIVERAAREVGLKKTTRPEELSLQDFMKIVEILEK